MNFGKLNKKLSDSFGLLKNVILLSCVNDSKNCRRTSLSTKTKQTKTPSVNNYSSLEFSKLSSKIIFDTNGIANKPVTSGICLSMVISTE